VTFTKLMQMIVSLLQYSVSCVLTKSLVIHQNSETVVKYTVFHKKDPFLFFS